MEFGLVDIDGFHPLLQGKPNYINTNDSNNNDGSGLLKHERSNPFDDESNRASKSAKRADDLGLRSDDAVQMLSFSSSTKPAELTFLSAKDVRLVADKNGLSYSHASTCSRPSAGFGSGNMNGGMHGSFTGIRGPFTPAQWIELEHQAMIYKYLTANVPVPSNLLIPIRKAIHSSGFPGFSIGSYPTHSYGWGSFHLGFAGSTDPEPGRCRRTDGKKWRCSRDAVPDQKYCERHINRGRHRSRKPVEGHTGQAASGATTTKVIPAMSASMSSLVTSSGGASNGVAVMQQQIKGLPPAGATNAIANPSAKRLHDQQDLSVMPPTINLDAKDSPYSMSKQHILFEGTSPEFGVVSTDSLLNPSQKSSYLDSKAYHSLLEFSTQPNQEQYPLRHLMDNLPKEHSRSSVPWPKDLKSDWTQLSMSIPMSTDFSSSSPSQNPEKVDVQPLRLSCELDPSQMGLGVGTIGTEMSTKQNTWIPVTRGNPVGGPLGEVLLNNATNSMDKGERWDGSPQLGSSPTGVLQKSTFVSLSNSSSGGSPRDDVMKTQEGVSLCDDLLGSAAHTSAVSIPSV